MNAAALKFTKAGFAIFAVMIYMANFKSGVASFIKTYAVVEVYFPVNEKGFADISCNQCPYLSSNQRMCQLNKKPVAFPQKHVGDWCPLNKIEEKEE